MLSVDKITPDKIALFKSVRLRALQDAPWAFGSTYQHEVNFTDDDWRARIERCNGVNGAGFMAMDGDVPCGIAACLIDQASDSRGELVSIWTAPTHRHRGIGALLVTSAIDWGRSRKLRVLRLMVTETNASAIRLYERLGFAMTGRTEPYPNDPTVTELEMYMSLSSE